MLPRKSRDHWDPTHLSDRLWPAVGSAQVRWNESGGYLTFLLQLFFGCLSLLSSSNSIPLIFYSAKLSKLNSPPLLTKLNLLWITFFGFLPWFLTLLPNSRVRRLMDDNGWVYAFGGCYNDMKIGIKYRYGKVVNTWSSESDFKPCNVCRSWWRMFGGCRLEVWLTTSSQDNVTSVK